MCGYGTRLTGGLLFRTREPDPIPAFDIAPPGGHERHNPLRGRERAAAWTRGSAATRTTPGFMTQRLWRWGASPEGVMTPFAPGPCDGRGAQRLWRWGRGNDAGDDPLCAWKRRWWWAIAVSPLGIHKVVPCPIPLRESQRDHDCGDGRGPISPSGNAQGRAIAVFPPGIRRSCLAPSPSGNPNGILP